MIFYESSRQEGGCSDDDDDNHDDHNDAWTNLHGIEVTPVGTTDLPHKEDFPIRCKYMLRYFIGVKRKHQNMIHQSRKNITEDNR